MEGFAEIPECLSVIICDQVFRDERTHKQIIVGTFNEILAPQFPALHPRMTVLFTLTNGKGEYQLGLAVENARTGVPIAKIEGPLSLNDPLQIADFHVEVVNLNLPEPGKYWVCVIINGQTIKQRPFNVRLVEVKL